MKVKQSMARLLTVVNERKKLRNEYRKHLEDEYIARKKAEEKAAEVDRIEKLREQGIKTEKTEDEIKNDIQKYKEARKLRMSKSLDNLRQESKVEGQATAGISEGDLSLLSETK